MAVIGCLRWGYGYMIKEAMMQVYTWTRKKVPWQLLRKEQTVHLKACERSKLHTDRQTFDHARNRALTHPRVLWDSSKLCSRHVMALLLFENQDSSICLGLTGSHVPCLHVISCSCLLGCPFRRKKKKKHKNCINRKPQVWGSEGCFFFFKPQASWIIKTLASLDLLANVIGCGLQWRGLSRFWKDLQKSEVNK